MNDLESGVKTLNDNSKRKVKVDIYIPMSRCACDWQGFMDKVFQVLLPYLKEIDFETKDSGSEEAKARKLPIQCVVVGEEVFPSTYGLKTRLPALVEKRGA